MTDKNKNERATAQPTPPPAPAETPIALHIDDALKNAEIAYACRHGNYPDQCEECTPHEPPPAAVADDVYICPVCGSNANDCDCDDMAYYASKYEPVDSFAFDLTESEGGELDRAAAAKTVEMARKKIERLTNERDAARAQVAGLVSELDECRMESERFEIVLGVIADVVTDGARQALILKLIDERVSARSAAATEATE